jgi:hypothetical protein
LQAESADKGIVRKILNAALCTAALAFAVTPASAAPPLELPALTRIASKLSGLKAKQKVKLAYVSGPAIEAQALKILDRDYPRDQQAYDETVYRALGLLSASEPLRPALIDAQVEGVRGLYDPVTRTLYVRKGADVRQVVLHELVHALQDQTFNLRRLSELSRGRRDAGLAAAAAVEGSATLATELTRSISERALASHGGSHARLFLGLESAFPYTTGVRFAAILKNLGGDTAIYGSLRRFPETTEQIFHLDAFLSREAPAPVALPDVAAGMTLDRTDTWGELDVRALLAVFQVPRLDHVGEGWAGGRTAIYRDVSGEQTVALVLDWENEIDALQWREAVYTYVNEAFDGDATGFPATAPCEADTCWSLGEQIAFTRNGTHTALVLGRSVSQVAALARAIVR